VELRNNVTIFARLGTSAEKFWCEVPLHELQMVCGVV
jgi:hypothetical protein